MFKFFLRLPSAFSPNAMILKQPVCESATNAELQRICSLYISLRDWVRRDGRHDILVNRRIFKLVVESIESNHIAKKIFNYCFERGDLQRMNLDNLVPLVPLFDDFQAVYIPLISNLVYENLEVFGLTRNAMYKNMTVPMPNGAAFQEMEATGIIATNTSTLGNVPIRLTLQELNQWMANLELLTRIHALQRRNGRVLLPIYVRYREIRNVTWQAETRAWWVNAPSNRENIIGYRKTMKPGTFPRQFMLP